VCVEKNQRFLLNFGALSPKHIHQSMRSEYSLRRNMEHFQKFLILQIWGKPDVLKTFQKQFWKPVLKPKTPRILRVRKIPCGLFPKPLKQGIFSVIGIFIEDYLRNLTCYKIQIQIRTQRTKIMPESLSFFNKQKFGE
jgi:hypothetical protein